MQDKKVRLLWGFNNALKPCEISVWLLKAVGIGSKHISLQTVCINSWDWGTQRRWLRNYVMESCVASLPTRSYRFMDAHRKGLNCNHADKYWCQSRCSIVWKKLQRLWEGNIWAKLGQRDRYNLLQMKIRWWEQSWAAVVVSSTGGICDLQIPLCIRYLYLKLLHHPSVPRIHSHHPSLNSLKTFNV